MRKCPSCGFNNPESKNRCVKCSTLLTSAVLPDGSHVADKRPPMPDPMIVLRRVFYWIGQKLGGHLPAGVPHRYYWTAAYLSLIPGGGQFYNYQKFKAGVFIAIWMLMVGAAIVTITAPYNNWVMLALAFWIFYVMSDGFVTANRINGAYWRWKQLLAVWFAFMFFWGVFLATAQFIGSGGLFYLVTVRQDELAPGFERGDKVFVLGSLMNPKVPQKGTVVYYDPPPYTITKSLGYSNDTYSVNARNSFGVITATEGEIVSVGTDGVIRVDGKPAPPDLLPLYPNGVPYEEEFRIPPEHYGILTSAPVSDVTIFAFLGGSWGSAVPSPRSARENGGYGLFEYEESCQVKKDDVWGVALFTYYPPTRRRWLGWTNGIWESEPPDYPQPRRR